MAYEENGKITHVVGDFDCFLLGTKGVKYEKAFNKHELLIMSWCIEEIGGILATPKKDGCWITGWLEVKKKPKKKGVYSEEMPMYCWQILLL